MDLSAWDFQTQGTVDLAGEWEFYWKRFLKPDDFRGKLQPGPVEYMVMPQYWNGRTIGGKKLTGHGYATLRLLVRFGGRQGICAMYLPHMFTAYRLWGNGRLLSSAGTIGADKAHAAPRFHPQVVILSPDSDTLDLVLQISNFHHPNGGMWLPIKLGTDTQIISERRHVGGFNSFLLGGLLLMALYHIGIFLFRKQDRASLFFGILCLVMAVRVPFEGDRMIISHFSWLGWEMSQKITYITFLSSAFVTNLYLYNLFPDIYSRTLVRVSTVLGVVFCLSVVVLTSQIYFFFRYPYYAAMMLWMVYDIYIIVRATMMKKEGAAYIVGGMLILLPLVCIDILYYDKIINFGNVAIFGVFIFTISQTMLLSARSSKAFTRVEVLSTEKAQLFANSIDIISSILLASSTRLFEYTQNVTRIAVMLARRIGLGPEGVDEIRVASLLHDIGMVGHPEELAGKANLITEAERLILENHSRKSIEIIEGFKGLAGVKMIIAQHHERYDGSGYPSRLKGKEIVIGARIIGLVDDFVLMLGRREFQTEDKKNRIVGELVRQKDLLYDPALVDALVQLIEKRNLVYMINEDDIRHAKNGNASEWVFPSNVNYEISVAEKVIAEVRSQVIVNEDSLSLIEAGLGEVIRNAIIHGNKYDEAKQVRVKFSLLEHDGRKALEFSIADQGSGMDLTRFNHFKESRLKLYDIVREMKQHISLLESDESRVVFGDMNRKLQSFLMEYYMNYNQYRRLDSPDATGGIGLIQVMHTFDNVDFRPIVANHAFSGLEVILEKYID